VEDKLQTNSAARGSQSAALISQSVEAKSLRKERHRRVHNNSGRIFAAAPERKLRSRFFCLNGHCPRIVFFGPALTIDAPDARKKDVA